MRICVHRLLLCMMLVGAAELLSHSVMAQTTGVNTPAGQVLNLGTGGTTYMTIGVNGNVAINTSPSAGVALDLRNGVDPNTVLQLAGTGLNTTQLISDTNLWTTLKNVSAGPLVFGTSNTTRMFIAASGNVGIGQQYAPADMLHIGAGTTTVLGGEAGITLQTGNGSGGQRSFRTYVSITDFNYHVKDTGLGTDAFTIQYGTGYVGIGNSAPQSLMSIGTGTDAIVNGIANQRVDINVFGQSDLYMHDSTDHTNTRLTAGAGFGEVGTTTSYPFYIVTNNAVAIAVLANGMTQFNGDVGIGVAPSATYGLDVSTYAVHAGAYYHGSDARLKTDIRPITHALDKVLALKGIEFNWKQDGRPDMGMTAQNVAEVFPNVVRSGSDGMMSVEYDSIVGPLIEAMRELKAKDDQVVARQRATSHQLEIENARLEAEISDIRKSLVALKKTP